MLRSEIKVELQSCNSTFQCVRKSFEMEQNMEFEYYVRQQLERHKSIQPQDIVKLCYQAAYGAEHMLADMEAAKKYFYTEYDSVSEARYALQRLQDHAGLERELRRRV